MDGNGLLVTAAVVAGLAVGMGDERGGELPSAIAFWNAENGLLAAGEAISATHDGGRTWTALDSVRGLKAIDVAGHVDAWALSGRFLRHSRDGGRSWSRIRLTRKLGWVDFATRTIGWGLEFGHDESGGEVSSLHRTSDGGRTWQRIANPCRRWYGLPQASLATASRGWMACPGQPGAGMQEKGVYETRDGGMTWRLRACACGHIRRGRLPITGYLSGLAFGPEGSGMLLLSRREPVFVSHDAGRTWTTTSAGRPDGDIGLSASVVSRRVGYALVLQGPGGPVRLVGTSDGGRTWRHLHAWHE